MLINNNDLMRVFSTGARVGLVKHIYGRIQFSSDDYTRYEEKLVYGKLQIYLGSF